LGIGLIDPSLGRGWWGMSPKTNKNKVGRAWEYLFSLRIVKLIQEEGGGG